MSAVASSRINKSGKKFAPKAPVRRGPPPSRPTRPEPVVVEDAEPTAIEQVEPPTDIQPPQPLPVPGDIPLASTAQAAVAEPGVSTELLPPPEPVNSARSTNDESTPQQDPVPILIPAPGTIASTPRTRRTSGAVPINVPSIVPVAPAPTASTNIVALTASAPESQQAKRKRTGPSKDQQTKVGTRKRQRTETTDEENQTGLEAQISPRQGGGSPVARPSRRSRRGATPQKDGENTVTTADTPGAEEAARSKKPHTRRKPQKKSMEEIAAEVVGDATGEGTEPVKRGRKRQVTPENAEDHKIDTNAMAMGDLTKDTRLGKKSEREVRLQNTDWDEVKRKRKLLEEARLAGPPRDPTPGDNQQHVPQFNIVNGQIVMVEGSQFVSTGGLLDENTTAPAAINEDDIVNRVNSGTLGRKKNHIGNNRWDEEATQRFYRGLRMFGTDFMMISQIFPHLSRRHIKSKFVKEERANPELIKQALLGPREPVNLDELSKINNTTYGEVSDFQKELDADQKEQEAAYAKQKAEEAKQAAAAAAAATASAATGGSAANLAASVGAAAAKANRFDAIADEIVNAATGMGTGGTTSHIGKRGVAAGGGAGRGRRGPAAAASATAKNANTSAGGNSSGGGKGTRVEGGEARILGPVE